MTNKTRIRISFICAIIMMAAAFFAFLNEYERKGTVFFAATLKSAHVDDYVVIGDRKFDVKNGDVTAQDGVRVTDSESNAALRTLYALTLARRTPLFDLEGTDVDSLDSSIQELAKIKDQYAAAQTTDENAAVIRSALYPLDFLAAISKSERYRRAFMQSHSESDSRAYSASLHSTVDAYVRDLASYRNAIQTVLIENPNGHPYIIAGGLVSESVILDLISQMGSGVESASRTLVARDSCVSGVYFACNANDILMGDSQEISVSKTESVPPIVTATVSVLTSSRPAKGTVILMEDSACARGVDAPPYYFWTTEYENPLHFVGDVFFEPPESAGWLLGIHLATLGASHVPLSLTSFYRCPEIGGDIARAALAVRLATVFHEESPVDEPQMKKKLSAIAGALAASSSPSQYISDAYAPLFLEARDKSNSFDLLAHEMVLYEKNNLQLAGQYGYDLSPAFLLTVRSGYFSLFMAYNPSVAGDFSTVFPEASDQKPFADYLRWSAMEGDLSRDDVINDLKLYANLHIF